MSVAIPMWLVWLSPVVFIIAGAVVGAVTYKPSSGMFDLDIMPLVWFLAGIFLAMLTWILIGVLT